ncbi:phage tail fiber domain-containing protein, partial [Klebsiella pneumoniae]|uniref:phage tail fiber domain-containing protein n=1 Tax=Klebsiella pneumoniae TaxID=573 RepID=UPI003F7F8F1B
MTVSTQVSRNEYTGNGATTQYDFTFRILDKSHLLVQTLDTSESIVTLTLGTDYTVTGVNRYNGGKVVLTSALPAGYKISIERSTPVTQEASIRNQGGFFPEIHEDAFDKLTMLVQQAYGWWSGLSLRKPSWLANYYDALNNRIRNLRDPSQEQDAATKNYVDSADNGLQQQITSNFNRSLRVPDSNINQLPSAQDRAWKGLGFDGAGQPKLQDPAGTGLWGYVPAIGSFEQGSLLTQRFEVLLWESTDEYWRWDGVMPKVILSGSTPDTAGGRGKGKWIDVTDATLRASLISDDGLKLVGKCATIYALRTIEPTYAGQSITLQRAVTGGHEINCSLWYDADDLTTADDGYSVFVTAGGARWKADVSRGIDIRLAGLLSDNSNLGTVLNTVITGEVNKIKAAGTIKGAITKFFIP